MLPVSQQNEAGRDPFEGGVEPKKQHYRFKINAQNFIVALYLLIIYVFSASQGFLFFTDSNTYLSGNFYVPILSELLAIYPAGSAALGIANTIIVYKMTQRYGINLFTIFLLSPYNMLLLTNATKESIIFLGLFVNIVAFTNIKNTILRVVLRIAGAAMLVIRPIYFLLYISRLSPYLIVLMAILFAFFIQFHSVPHVVSGMFTRLEGREYVGHVGRHFFDYLCVKEKADYLAFTQCWMPVFLGFPQHEDTLSINYLPFIVFQMVYLALVYLCLISKIYKLQILAVMAILLHYFIFLVSPTLGAFIRYAHPVVWMLGFSIWAYKSNMLKKFKLSLFSRSARP